MRLTAETVFLGAVGVIMVVALIGGAESSVTANAVLESTPASIPWFLLGMFPLIALATLHVTRKRHQSPTAQTLEAAITHAPVNAVGREFPIPDSTQKILTTHPDLKIRESIQQTVQRFDAAYQKAVQAAEARSLADTTFLLQQTQTLLHDAQYKAQILGAYALPHTQLERLAQTVSHEVRVAQEIAVITELNTIWRRALEIPADPKKGEAMLTGVRQQYAEIQAFATGNKVSADRYGQIDGDVRREINRATERILEPLLSESIAYAQIAKENEKEDITTIQRAQNTLKVANEILESNAPHVTNRMKRFASHARTEVEQTAKQVIGSRKENIETAAQQGVWDPVRVQEYAKLANGPGDAEGLQKTMRTYLEHGGDPSAILATIMVDDWYTIPRGNSYLKEVRKNIIWHTPISEIPEKLKIYRHLKKYGMDAYLQGNTDGTLEKELLHRGEGAYKVMRKKLLTVLEEAYAGEDHTTFTDNMKDFFSTFKTQTWLQSKNPLRNSAHQEIERHLWQTYLDNRLGGARHHLRAQEISELKTSAQEHNVYDRFKDRFTALEQAATQERAA